MLEAIINIATKDQYTDNEGRQGFMGAGQSNKRGSATINGTILTPDEGTAFEFLPDNNIINMTSQVGTGVYQATNYSCDPKFAIDYYNSTKRKVVIIPTAVGSTALTPTSDSGAGNWSASGSLRSYAIGRGQAYEALTGKKLRGILWIQGERDATYLHDNPSYETSIQPAIESVFDAFLAAFPTTPIYVTNIGQLLDGSNLAAWNTFRGIMETVCATKDGVYLSPINTQDFVPDMMDDDNVHWGLDAQNLVGAAYATLIQNNY